MNETKKTMIFGAVAVGLLVLAAIFSPGKITPDAFLDRGEPFFPDFTDPNSATTLEVVDFDQQTGRAKPFKVTFSDGRWTIPSHHNYPADGQDRLARTAAGVIDIKKDDFRTDNVSDHVACGVIDPLDETAGLQGRGQRVTIKGESDRVLADFIIGKEVEGRQNIRLVRVPGQNRVYAVRMDIDISTRFEDWINTDLLGLTAKKIERLSLKNYSINERTLSIVNRDDLTLRMSDDQWKADRNREVDTTMTNEMVNTLAQLAIVGVRPKPTGLSATLKGDKSQQISRSDMRSLQSKGFYLGKDGQLLANEGELWTHTTDGIIYRLRFGEVVIGSGLAVTAGTAASSEDKTAENRYLFITAEFDENYFKQPQNPSNRDFESKEESLWTDQDRANKEKADKVDEWTRKVQTGRGIAGGLNARFAEWYYVISSDSFEKIHRSRSELVL